MRERHRGDRTVDPNLFDVMVSRPRRRCVVVDSGVADGLLAAYIKYAYASPDPTLLEHRATLGPANPLCRLGWSLLDAFPSR